MIALKLSDLYGGRFKAGPAVSGSPFTAPASTAAPLRITLVTPPTDGTAFVPAVFMLKITAGGGNIHALQGGDAVAADTGEMSYSNNIYWRIDVDSKDDAYLSILSTAAATRTVAICRIDSVNAPGSP